MRIGVTRASASSSRAMGLRWATPLAQAVFVLASETLLKSGKCALASEAYNEASS